MPSEAHVLLVLAGLAAGFINTLAGGGSLLTLPALIFLGLDANVANGTNRVAVLVQNGTAVVGFARQGHVPGRLTLALLPPAVLGAFLGARVAVEVPEAVLRAILAGVLVLSLPAVFLPEGGTRAARSSSGSPAASVPGRIRLSPWMYGVFAAIGFYGGFIQAGVGLLILGVLVSMLGLDLVRANALKVAIVLAHTAIALPVFVARGQVDASAGLLLAASNMAGAWVGTRLALHGGARVVRWVLAIAILVCAAQLLGLTEWLSGRLHE
jgi:uncharacterized membrane protein YfcA